ncbi:hypothetical protein BC830DRAFT_1166872 [Chytriomyces sp. MP71]|nr:hypothetical protein BC830DRAFT_1166872 [Chytriomyces sp. MP71]
MSRRQQQAISSTAAGLRVLVSGGGIAGPTVAHFLARAGANVLVVEKAPGLQRNGQNVDINGSARRVVAKMGLTDQVIAHNTTEKGTCFVDDGGRAFAEFPIGKGSFTSQMEILRSDLAKILYEHTKKNPNVEFKFDTKIDKVLENNDHGVKVLLSDGSTHAADVLIAADGTGSQVRKMCFDPATIKRRDTGVFVAYWTVPRETNDSDWWAIHQTSNSKTISLRPDPYHSIRVMVTCLPRTEAHRTQWRTASRANRSDQERFLVREIPAGAWQGQRLHDTMLQAPDFYIQAMQQIQMDSWSSGRVVCLGDAAYAPTPLTGMGTPLALMGGYLLAGELSKTWREHPQKAFATYEALYRSFVEETQQYPSIAPKLAHARGPMMRWLTQTAIWSAAKVTARQVATAGEGQKVDEGDKATPTFLVTLADIGTNTVSLFSPIAQTTVAVTSTALFNRPKFSRNLPQIGLAPLLYTAPAPPLTAPSVHAVQIHDINDHVAKLHMAQKLVPEPDFKVRAGRGQDVRDPTVPK